MPVVKKFCNRGSSCGRFIKNPSKWVMIKAHSEGWYEQKDGTVWCPDHRPEWAPKEWR